MPITSQQLKAWAGGLRSDAIPASQAESRQPGEEIAPDDELAEEELEEGPGNSIWSGEVPGDQVTDETAEELVEWLAENEPEVAAAVTNLATAVETMDVAKLEAAKEELKTASQFLNPEYPEFSPAERMVAPAAIESRLEGGGGTAEPELGAVPPENPEEPGVVPGAVPPKVPPTAPPAVPPKKPGVLEKPGALGEMGAQPTPDGSPSPKKAIAAGIADVRHAGGPTPGPEFEDLPATWTQASRMKFYKSLGGSLESCVSMMAGVPGIKDPEAFCGALEGQEVQMGQEVEPAL